MDIQIRVAEDPSGAVGICLSMGNIVYVGSIDTAERLVDTLLAAIRQARRMESSRP